jgi:heptosyltransferase-2
MSQKVLIRTPNHLGDCVMALPLINEVGELYPNAEITILVPDNLFGLFDPNPAIDEIIKIPPKYIHGLIAITKIKDMISSKKYDVVYVLPKSYGAAASFKLAGIKERIGYISDKRRLLLSKPIVLPSPVNSAHRSELYYNLLRRATGKEIDYVKPKLFLNDNDISKGRSLLSNFGIKDNDKFVTIAFRAVAESRRWGTDNYIELSKIIIAQLNHKIVLIGTENDRNVGDEIVESAGASSVVNLSGKTSLRELASVISQSNLFIGNDSGPAHLAAAVSVPIVVLSGADDPLSTSPLSNEKSLIYLKDLECISCVKNKCPLKKDDFMKCMKSISVDMVLKEVKQYLEY